jgi:hypothetical protein
MKRIAFAALAASLLMLAAQARMSEERMDLAVHAVKATAMVASEYERCGVNSSRLLDTMIAWAANSCRASNDQLAELRRVYGEKLKDVADTLRTQSLQCRWTPQQTQTELQADVSRVGSFVDSQCRK